MENPEHNRESLEAGPDGSSAVIASLFFVYAMLVLVLPLSIGFKLALTFLGVGVLAITLARVRPEVWWEFYAVRAHRETLGDRGLTWYYQILGWVAVLAGLVFLVLASLPAG